MDVKEIFSRVINHQVEGMMFHNDMTNYFDFLCLCGFKRAQKYRFNCETKEMRKTTAYFIETYNMLPDEITFERTDVIPSSWARYSRQDVDPNTKAHAVEDAFTKWVKWEDETKTLYEGMATELHNLGEVDAYEYMARLSEDVSRELKCAQKLKLKLEAVNYDMCAIDAVQMELHEKYKKRMK